MKIWKTWPHYEVYHERSAFPMKVYFYDISFFIFDGLVERLTIFEDELQFKRLVNLYSILITLRDQ